jgi:hypothetical protein
MLPQPNPAPDSFFNVSKKIAKSFLQSVVVVDDQATFDEAKPEETPKQELITPTIRGGRGIDPDTRLTEPQDVGQSNPVGPSVTASEPISEVLNVKRLNDCFAESGLVCCVLKPTEDETALIANKADHIARRADIVVFDWLLSKKEQAGATALNSIHAILNGDLGESTDPSPRSRTRLIAIYTSLLELDKIVEETQIFLQGKGLNFAKEENDEFSLLKDGAKIVFYRKNRGLKPPVLVQARTVSEDELIDRLIDDFTKMTYGLLSNIALDSLGALRDNTHRILRKFERRLDAPYVTHRTMVTPSDEAQQHPVPLLTAEFNDVLEDCGVDKHASLEMIDKWLNHQIESGEIILKNKIANLSADQLKIALIDIVKNGVDAEFLKHKENGALPAWKTELGKVKSGDANSAITKLLINDDTASSRDLDFAILTTMRSRYEKPEPMLTLGTIVAKTEGNIDKYYICIQPVCDSVRLKQDTVFPFLKLHDSADPNDDGKIKENFDIVVKDNGTYKKLRTNLKPRDILLATLKHQPSEEIRAEQNVGGPFVFKTLDHEPDLRWVGDLKFAHAQRVANDFAREISRVGLMESDWLRRMK